MNVAVLGSVSSSWHALEALLRGGVEVTGVLGVDESQAARISDYRSLRDLAVSAQVPFHSFVKVSEPGVAEFLSAHPPDLLWVIGISQLVPDRLIAIARDGGIGFHPTLLPEGRGRAPVAWTILRDARAAVSLFYLTPEPDAGDLIAQREVPVLPDDYSEDLIARTNRVLDDVVLDLAPALKAGRVLRTPQDPARVTHYPRRTPADGLINWSVSTDRIYRLIRAAGRPYPGAFTHLGQEQIILWRGQPQLHAPPVSNLAHLPAGTLCGDADTLIVRTQDGYIRLTEIGCTAATRRQLVPGARFTYDPRTPPRDTLEFGRSAAEPAGGSA